jgi:hypothetical protein
MMTLPPTMQRGNDLPLQWKQGQHVGVVGRTGSGKTYLISKLVQMRQYVVIFRTKPDTNKFPGFDLVRKATAMAHWRGERLLLEPEYDQQAVEGYRMLERAWRDGGWTIVIDENWYAEQQLGLKQWIVRLLTQGRSKDITVIVGMQRPVDISRFALSEITHLFTFRCEGRDLKFSLRDSTVDEIVPAVRSLRGHDFVYYNAAKEIITTGNANRLGSIFMQTKRVQPIDGSVPTAQAGR